LTPRVVPFSADAAALFWEFADEVEKEVVANGEFESIKMFAAKLPEHAARLALTLAAYRSLEPTELALNDFTDGIKLATWYAAEAKRISDSTPANWSAPNVAPIERLAPAEKLLDWLLHHWGKPTVTARDIYRYGPAAIRNREAALTLTKILVDHGWLTPLAARRRDMRAWQIVKGARS
jgi:hypothetical protein